MQEGKATMSRWDILSRKAPRRLTRSAGLLFAALGTFAGNALGTAVPVVGVGGVDNSTLATNAASVLLVLLAAFIYDTHPASTRHHGQLT